MAVAEQIEAAVTNALDASEGGSETQRYATVFIGGRSLQGTVANCTYMGVSFVARPFTIPLG